ncbi:MAG: ParA family protein [Candidatus Latescibacteria bacterium]|nr:ParA family protein [Candidatus Latescibacterota bacterium]
MIIAVVSAKGGTGKSTITLNLAGALSIYKKKVRVIDADPQGSIAQWSKIKKQTEPTIIIQSAPVVEKTIKKKSKKYDITIFDSPPTFKKRMKSIMQSSDMLIIPVTPGLADYWSTQKLVDIYLEEKEKKPNLDARLLINRIDRRTRLGKDFRVFLEKLSIPIFMTEIPMRIIYSEAWYAGLTVDRLQPNGNAAKDFRLLSKEVMLWLTKSCMK